MLGGDCLRCPLSVRGLNSPLMASCSGFSPLALSAPGSGPGAAITGTTCAHLGLAETARGFAPTCRHPRATAMVGSASLVAATPGVLWHELAGLEVAVIVIDPAGVVAFWNPMAEQLYGWPAESAVGMSIMDLTVDAGSTGRAAAIMSDLLGGFSWEGSWACRRRDDGLLLVRLLDVPLLAAGGGAVGIVGFSLPISDVSVDLQATARGLGLQPHFRPAPEMASEERQASSA